MRTSWSASLVFSLLGQIGVSRYLICLQEGSNLRIMASRIDGPAPQNELLTQLLKQRTALPLADIPVRGKVDPREVLTKLGLQVVVPMEIQGETRGLILLGEKLSKASFSRGDLSFLSSLGNLAVIALENARLFREAIEKQKMEDDLLLAREIQKGLLPTILPEIPGIELAAANVSSRQVGGDYYDVIALGDDRYVIAIGDVSGKGSPASLLMANLAGDDSGTRTLGSASGRAHGSRQRSHVREHRRRQVCYVLLGYPRFSRPYVCSMSTPGTTRRIIARWTGGCTAWTAAG